jgi:hypothetical protein
VTGAGTVETGAAGVHEPHEPHGSQQVSQPSRWWPSRLNSPPKPWQPLSQQLLLHELVQELVQLPQLLPQEAWQLLSQQHDRRHRSLWSHDVWQDRSVQQQAPSQQPPLPQHELPQLELPQQPLLSQPQPPQPQSTGTWRQTVHGTCRVTV